MKFSEAIKAIEDGKKVRHSSWSEHKYMCATEAALLTVDGSLRGLYGVEIDKDWEIYEEPSPKEENKYIWGNSVVKGGIVDNFLVFGSDEARKATKLKEALDTFYKLRFHRLAVKPIDRYRQEIIKPFWAASVKAMTGITVEEGFFIRNKTHYLSATFEKFEDAKTAIKEIGEQNLINMFKVLSGDFE